MGEESKRFGAWRAMESDPGYDGGAPTITTNVGTFEITLVLSKGDKFDGISQGNTCCPGEPTMEDLSAALDYIAIERNWWGEQLPASPFSDVMTKADHDRHARNNRQQTELAADLVIAKVR